MKIESKSFSEERSNYILYYGGIKGYSSIVYVKRYDSLNIKFSYVNINTRLLIYFCVAQLSESLALFYQLCR